uniref:Nuclear hormone receptor HR96-like n=1 Tax=Dermatophagoides pteronyssinus TaxID=6956 RepID=A0A6P6XSJ7_DERPT|nr:nuclear hormone receptor HR96-like [Dermatophagoides pteronyssinus]
MKNDNGQSSNNGNTISIFQTNLNEMAPESISDQYNYIENYRLEELNDACNQLNHWYYNGSILYEMRHLKEIYRVAEHVFQHFISMAKMITAFADLCETDQISLLKYSVTEILILRSVSCFMPNKDAWIFNLDNNEKGTMLQFNTCKSQIPEFSDDIRHFILAVPEKCRQDRNLFDLATMVVLFNPNCLDLKHKDVVKLEHITYCHLLCKYIHKNYSSTTTTTLTMEKTTEDAEKHSIIQFNTMLNLIDQLHKINQKINNNILPFHTIINEEYDKKHLTQA